MLQMQVTNLQLVTPALVRRPATLNVGATIVNLPRIEVRMRSPSVIDMLTEVATNELEDMEGELAFVPHFWKVDQHLTERQCGGIPAGHRPIREFSA